MSQTRQEVLAAEQAEVDINALRPDTGAKRGFIVGSGSMPLVLPSRFLLSIACIFASASSAVKHAMCLA